MKTGANPEGFAFRVVLEGGESLVPGSCGTFAPSEWADLIATPEDLARVLPSPVMPKPRPWLIDEDHRKSLAGRPRSGPRGNAVRALPRVTVRATSRTLALWRAVMESENLQSHDALAAVVAAYLDALPESRREAVHRLARRIRGAEYEGQP